MTVGVNISLGENGIVFSGLPRSKRNKGRNRILFPDDYCVIDIETTGFDSFFDEIIELGAIKVVNNEIVDTFSSFVKPSEPIEDFITELTGITDEMVENAPLIDAVIPQFCDYLGDSILVGHNVNFDVNFIYDNLFSCTKMELKNDFVDTLRFSRRILPELPDHQLSSLVNYYGLTNAGSHRALIDCEHTHYLLQNLKNDMLMKYGSFEEFKNSYRKATHGVKASDIVADQSLVDENHPLYDKVCVFTGTLEKMLRKEAMQLVANVGGVIGDSVTKKTNYLILGNNDYCKSIKDGKSSKQKKAEKLILQGADLQIITENVFYDMFE